jgi:hypothetical protein
MRTAPDDNSGVYLGFPDPTKEGYDNTAYVAVNFGFEVQIDELARPDNAAVHRTGAVYGFVVIERRDRSHDPELSAGEEQRWQR